MKLEEIKQILESNNKMFFGPKKYSKTEKGKYPGLPYIIVNVKEKTITFTTDTMDYSMPKKLEEAMEKLFSKFGVNDYKVQFHIHKGDFHDKDVILKLHDIEGVQDSAEIPEMIKFIQDNFYKVDKWDFAVAR